MADRFFYRLKIFVGGKSSFVSQNDQIKVLQRTLIRAEVSVRYTRGFNPRPLLSFGPARPTGFSSLSDMADVCTKEELNPEHMKEKLNDALPAGFSVLKVSKIDEFEFGKVNEKIAGAKVGVHFSSDVNHEAVLDVLNQAVSQAGKFMLAEEEEVKFFDILKRACMNAKISYKKEGRLAVFKSKSPTRTAPRIDKLLLNVDGTPVRKAIKGIYILDYELEE